MDEHDGSKPSASWLDRLHEAGHWERLIEIANRSLETDPNDTDTHRHLAWAYARTERVKEMKLHVDFLLGAEPDEPRNHHLAAVYHLDHGKPKRAKPHLDVLLHQNPNSAHYHYLACIHALRSNREKIARNHINKARELAPDWVAAAHLEIRMDGIRGKAASQAWNRIRRLEQTLAADPEESSIMATIGDIYLDELERPREAEAFYRDALRIDPMDRVIQRKLLDAMRARSLLYRTLSLPSNSVRRVFKGIREGRVRSLLVLLLIKPFTCFIVWAIVVGIFFAPGSWIYEWLALAEVMHTRTPPRMLMPLWKALRWPLWLRMTIALSAIVGGWLLLLGKVFHVPPLLGLQIMGWVFGVHFALVSLFVGVRKLRARFGHWQETRKLRRESGLAQSEMA